MTVIAERVAYAVLPQDIARPNGQFEIALGEEAAFKSDPAWTISEPTGRAYSLVGDIKEGVIETPVVAELTYPGPTLTAMAKAINAVRAKTPSWLQKRVPEARPKVKVALGVREQDPEWPLKEKPEYIVSGAPESLRLPLTVRRAIAGVGEFARDIFWNPNLNNFGKVVSNLGVAALAATLTCGVGMIKEYDRSNADMASSSQSYVIPNDPYDTQEVAASHDAYLKGDRLAAQARAEGARANDLRKATIAGGVATVGVASISGLNISSIYRRPRRRTWGKK